MSMESTSGRKPRQVAVTVAFGDYADRLDETFASFAGLSSFELHAFIIGDALPRKQCPEITYHLKAPDPRYAHPLRDAVYRRWEFMDELDADYAVVVDNSDVLCLQRVPDIPVLLRGAKVAACVEHMGSRYVNGQGWTSSYINCGVTFWDVKATRQMRQEILERGRAHFRNIDDQVSINEVIQTRYYHDLVILPPQYNYRAYVGMEKKGWPTVTHLDGVVIYHNRESLAAAKKLLPVKPLAELPPLAQDEAPASASTQFWRRVRERFRPHVVK